MIVYSKKGKDYFLMANSSRGVMKLPAAKLDSYEAITECDRVRSLSLPRTSV